MALKNAKRFDKYIVAIGASAGGLEAIHEFFDHMPVNASFSFIVIQHLSSDYKSLLVELVGKHTHMKVFEAGHDMAIQQDCVYIIPNNKLMTVSKGRLKLTDKSTVKAPNTAIDHFLFTLAADRGEKAIAIILSGTGTDGTKGIQAIKEAGGMVIVQEPSTARFDGMPNSAIASGNADFVLQPSEISKELFNYVNEEPVKVLEKGKIDETLLDEIFSLVHQQSGNDFYLYKTPTIIRRIGRRMNERAIRSLPAYVDLLKSDPHEVVILGKDFLIGVTRFFRDSEAFDALGKQLNEIISHKKHSDTLKIWVCACSTGQEAYTIAMLANESVLQSKKDIEIKIFATDIDEKSIEIAGKNSYPESVKKEIPSRFFKKYMVQEGNHYAVNQTLRKQVVFAKHDVTKSPPFIKNDLVTCRNMLIYVNSTLQEKILSTFHFSLAQGGYLFLGSSETASSLKQGLEEISGKWKIYKKNGAINYAGYNTYHTGLKRPSLQDKAKSTAQEPSPNVMEQNFNSFITKSLGYTGIYIDQSYLLQDAVGDYRRYLSLPEGKIELNILKMVPREISVSLNAAIRKAWKDQQEVHLQRLRVTREDSEVFFNISIQPPESDKRSGLTLLVFSESPAESVQEKEHGDQDFYNGNQGDYIFDLEAELHETRSNLQLAVEEMETTNEELQSTNEELLSANEELQSSNEELQSLNEELHTLNTEHQLKIKELLELNDDLDNYFRSTDIGQIFVDKDMYIRKFNASAIAMVNLIEADIGRSIEQISHNIIAENLTDDIQQVMGNHKIIEKEVLIRNATSSLMRIMPYVRKDKKTDGVVITFVDISKLTELNNIITGVYNASPNGILAFKAVRNKQHFISDFTCISMNQATSTVLGKDLRNIAHASLLEHLPALTENNLLQKYIAVVEKGTNMQEEMQLSTNKWIQIDAVKMADGFVATITDISKQKIADEKIRKNYNALLQARESLKDLNNQLELKVKERTHELSESETRFNLVSQATNDTIWDWNLADNHMWRSSNFSSMFGYGEEPENGNINFYFNIIHPEDRDRVKKSVYDTINQGTEQWSSQYRLKKADGSYATILDRGSILKDAHGIPYRMLGSILDISILADTETRLNTSERKFRKIFESDVIGMIFSNVNTGRIENANDNFLNLLGYTAADFENGEINWMNLTPEEFMPISKISADLLKNEGYCPPFEKQYRAKSGKLIDVLIGSAILDENNREDAVTYIIDITKQKHNEKRKSELQRLIKKQQDEFHNIFKKAPALISIRRGKNLIYEFVNEAYALFEGAADYIGQPLHAHSQFAHPKLKAIEDEVLKTGEPYLASAYHLKQKGAKNEEPGDKWFDLVINPVYASDGQIDGLSFFGFEVTDLVIAQRTTRAQMNKKDEFMSIASHELKTPITSIKGYMQFAMKMAGEKRFDRIFTFIDKADRQVTKLTGLVNDLLDVTKIQSGKMTFNYTTFNIADVINESLEGLLGSDGNQTIITDIQNIEVIADQNRIDQVVSNFLSNAIKYSPGQKDIIVTARKENKSLKVAVKDQGMGIPKDKVELIFNRFFRVEEASNNVSGLGLGLYISAQIIQRHGGEIGVESELGEGSTFWFIIPLKSN